MTKDQIFTEIQNVVANNPVLVIGSGASVPYHIPGMDSLATALKLFLVPTHTQIQNYSKKPYLFSRLRAQLRSIQWQ